MDSRDQPIIHADDTSSGTQPSETAASPPPSGPEATSSKIEVPAKLIDQVIGQDHAVEVIRKAAVQRRHVMMIGSPGTGKSMLAKGYYPEGGGDVVVEVTKKKIAPICCTSDGDSSCSITSCSSNLPDHVTKRQADAAAKYLMEEAGIHGDVTLDTRSGISTGSSCTVWRGAKGGSALGKRGLPAETVGQEAARTALSEFGNGADVDEFMADQLLVPLALFGGWYSAPALTSHAETTVWLLGQFGFEVRCRRGPPVEFSV